MNYYMLLLRPETIDFASYSPEDMQKILADFDKWNAEAIKNGKMIASANLSHEHSRTIRAGNIVTNGPYSEARESLTGFFLIRAENDDEAAAIGKGCPFIPRGGSVEVRLIPKLEFEDIAASIVEELLTARKEENTKSGKEA